MAKSELWGVCDGLHVGYGKDQGNGAATERGTSCPAAAAGPNSHHLRIPLKVTNDSEVKATGVPERWRPIGDGVAR